MLAIQCFSNTNERIRHKRHFNNFSKHNILYQKQFGFQNGHATEDVIMQLLDKTNDHSENIVLP